MRFLQPHGHNATISWVWTRWHARLPEPEFISVRKMCGDADEGDQQSFGIYRMDAAFAPADKIFKDGETVTEADLICKVLLNSGHTRGGVCLVCGDDGVLRRYGGCQIYRPY